MRKCGQGGPTKGPPRPAQGRCARGLSSPRDHDDDTVWWTGDEHPGGGEPGISTTRCGPPASEALETGIPLPVCRQLIAGAVPLAISTPPASTPSNHQAVCLTET